jgi:chorismate-pyruvate lyase
VTRSKELEQEIESFTAQLRDAETFTGTAAHWLRTNVDYVSTRHEYLSATVEYAAALEVEAGSDVLYRCGRLQVRRHQVIADVCSVVATERLTEDARAALDARTMPLGLILNQLGARRYNRKVSLIEATGQFGRQVMQVDAMITMTEYPVAVVSETVYRRLFVSRGPAA